MYLEKHVISILIREGHPCALRPVKFGNEKNRRFVPYTPTPKWDYYMVHYIFDGCGYVHIGGQTHKLRAGDAFFVRPGESVAYHADRDDPWHYAWIGFVGEDAARFAEQVDHIFSLPSQVFSPLLQMEKYKGAEDFLLCSILYRMLAELLSKKSGQMSYAEQAAHYMQNHFAQAISISHLAEEMRITPRYLSSLFKKEFGKTPQDFLQEVRLEHAKGLLSIGRSVSDAAFASGYSDAFVFSRAFKKRYGVSPKYYFQRS